MRKKILLIVLVAIIPVTAVIVVFNILTQIGIDIKIKNETNKEISGLYVTYNEIKSDVEIPTLKQGEKYKLNVSHGKNSNKNFSEGALLLEYKDKNGQKHTEYLVGYIERGYSGFINIKLSDIDENGKIKMDIKDFAYWKGSSI